MNQGTCIHFTGFGLGRDPSCCCAAGVNYAEAFDDDAPGLALRAPCVEYRLKPAHSRGTYIRAGESVIRIEVDRRGQTVIPCGRRIEPTDEQVQQVRAETDASYARHMMGIRVANAWRVKPKPKQSRQEVVECPACKGRLHLAQSAINGHVHGECETPSCVKWME